MKQYMQLRPLYSVKNKTTTLFQYFYLLHIVYMNSRYNYTKKGPDLKSDPSVYNQNYLFGYWIEINPVFY